MDDQDKPTLTSAQTDAETGDEGLDADQNHAKHRQAIQVMFDKGLISEEDYKRLIARPAQ